MDEYNILFPILKKIIHSKCITKICHTSVTSGLDSNRQLYIKVKLMLDQKKTTHLLFLQM